MKANYLPALAAALFLAACDDVLNKEPEQTISDQAVIVDANSAETALTGVYDQLQGYASSNLIGHELAADNVVAYNNQNNLIPDLTPSSGGGGFTNIYRLINQANFVLANVPNVSDPFFTEENRKRVLGEAYFLRALAYLDLGRTFGGVQIVLTPAITADAHTGIKRSSLEQTYARVLSDLNEAEALLPATVRRNRASRYTVYALKARLYLYTAQWSLAEEYAGKVIESTGYALVKPYANFFTGRNTQESIFELAYNTSDRNTFYTNWLSPADGGRHDYVPAREFVGLILDPQQGGSRKSLLKQTAEGGWDLIQYGKQDGTSSLFLFRIAEQYLIRAEARARKASPDLAGAVDDLNKIKARADVPLFTLLPETTAAEVEEAVFKERRFELPFEGHRFTDVVRTNRAAEIFGSINPNLKNPQRWVFPIPLSAIQNDPDLDQNPGY